MLAVGDTLNTEQLVLLLGSDKQQESYYRYKKLVTKHKKSILRKLDKIAHFEEIKVGRNKLFYITAIKDKVEQLEAELKYGNKFDVAIDKKIIEFLKKLNIEGEAVLTSNHLIKKLELTNSSYWLLRNAPSTFIKKNQLKMDYDMVRYFSYLSRSIMVGVIKSALERLDRENIIKLEQGLIIITKEGQHLRANERETNLINLAQKNALEELKCKDIKTVMFFNKSRKFDTLMKVYLNTFGIDYLDNLYSAFFITNVNINTDEITEQEKDILDEHLSNNFKDSIRNSALARRKKILNQDQVMFGNSLGNRIEISESFIENIDKLMELVFTKEIKSDGEQKK